MSIFVFDSRGRLLVQKRSASKDEFPSLYTSSASGHVSAGESYDEAAPRELQEELGLNVPIEYLGKFFAGAETANEHTALYRAVTDDPPQFDPIEIESGAYYGLDRVAERVAAAPADFTPPFRVLFQWYWTHRRNDL